jgi:hypothetical protein
MIRKLMFLMTLVGLLAAVGMAAAKGEPYVEDPDEDFGGTEDAFALPEGLNGFILAGRFAADDDVDAFTFSTLTPLSDVRANVLVPTCGEHFEGVFPSVALIGPGLEAVEDVEDMPFTVPVGQGVLLLADEPQMTEDGEREGSDWEYFGRHVYAPGIYTFDLPEVGEYALVLWEPNGNVGAYMLDFGTNEEHLMSASRSDSERDAAFNLLTSGRFMAENCRAPVSG